MHEGMTVKEVAEEIDDGLSKFPPARTADARLLGLVLRTSYQLHDVITSALRGSDAFVFLDACEDLINREIRGRMVRTAIKNRTDRWHEIYLEKINRELRGEAIEW
ncbi:MAG: hypothetical protein WA151_14695 [Desulfatirhabdiaceae bacterium]